MTTPRRCSDSAAKTRVRRVDIQKLRCTCASCHHVFDAEIVVEAPISVAVSSLQAIRCPSCGAPRISIGGSYTDAPSVTASLVDRAAWWTSRGEHGISSDTIYTVFAGCTRPRRTDVPHDPDDFRRCRQLFDLIPEWRSRIEEVALVYPWYRPFTERWDEMDRLWEEESPSGKCPKLYELMAVARAETDLIG